MQVNFSGCGYNKYAGAMSSTKSKAVFAVNDNEKETQDDVLSYYQKLCKEFDGGSFRLDDLQETSKHADDVYLGYNNSFNQSGNNFGNMGQCSISLDVSVIERMKNDPNYEERIKGMIRDSYTRYSQYEANAVQDGYSFVSISIEDNNGVPIRGVKQSHVPYSTEEEVRELWNNADMTKKLTFKIESQKQQMLDSYMKMFDVNRRRKSELNLDN